MSGTGAWEIRIDRDECVSAGRCVASAPELFVFDDDELATVRPDAPLPDGDTLLRLARNCPNGAIRVLRDGVDVEI